MEFHERLLMRPVLFAKLHELHGNDFERFFQNLMAMAHPDFVPVRTHGQLGDQGSDGLLLSERKLYACYAPEVPDANNAVAKLRSDVASAVAQRADEFDTFVFVHNDTRGVHPEVATALATLQTNNPDITFELIGLPKMRDLASQLTKTQFEDLVGAPLPIEMETTSGITELTDLLEELAQAGVPASGPVNLSPVSGRKLAFSGLSQETQAEIREALKFVPSIEGYYAARFDVTERDDVAARMRIEYESAAFETTDPEEVLWRMTQYVNGSKVPTRPRGRAVTGVLAYYFETCDIFEDAPDEWVQHP